ncbi:MAG: hypothetical protein OHK0046_19890 [Anaerolineae bacterium]
MDDPIIPRKWMLRAHGQQNVFTWNRQERSTHTLMKAFLWALYLPQYPQLSIEIFIGDRYKPDVVALPELPDPRQALDAPLFWGESGQVGRDKIHNLVRKYKSTHFAIAKWGVSLEMHRRMVEKELKGVARTAPFDLLHFPADSLKRFIDGDGNITVTHAALQWVRLE